MKGSFRVWSVSVNPCFVNWVCANSPGIKELVFCKKNGVLSFQRIWSFLHQVRLPLLYFMWQIHWKNSNDSVLATIDYRKRMTGKKPPCVRYISHVKDTTKRYANAILSVGGTANYIKKSKTVVKIAFLAQNNLFQIIVLFLSYDMLC